MAENFPALHVPAPCCLICIHVVSLLSFYSKPPLCTLLSSLLGEHPVALLTSSAFLRALGHEHHQIVCQSTTGGSVSLLSAHRSSFLSENSSEWPLPILNPCPYCPSVHGHVGALSKDRSSLSSSPCLSGLSPPLPVTLCQSHSTPLGVSGAAAPRLSAPVPASVRWGRSYKKPQTGGLRRSFLTVPGAGRSTVRVQHIGCW